MSGQSDKAGAMPFFVPARYNLDATFGNGGKVVIDPSPNGSYTEI